MKLHQLFCILPLLPLFPLLGCSGGGSDSADDHNPGDPPSPEPQASAWLFLDGPCYARTGEPFTATLSVLSPPESGGSSPAIALTPGPGKPWTFELLEGPAGLSLDPISGAVFWVPAIDSSGGQAITVRFSSGAETHEETLTLMVEGVQLAASQFVHANAGGTVTVLDIASPMYGTSIVIPAGAMEADGEIRAHSVQGGVTLPAAAQGFDLSPSQNFAQPVRIEYHYTDEWVADLGIASEFNIALFHRNEATGAWEMLNTIVNPTLNIARATTTSFSSFALFVNDLDAITGPLANSIYFIEPLRPCQQSNQADAAVDFLLINSLLWQKAELVHVKGKRFERHKKNALLIHGVTSRPENFQVLQDFAIQRYDNVVFYRYPSGRHIRDNAATLERLLGENAMGSPDYPFSTIDVIAHSMGGLVARALHEDPALTGRRTMLPFANLITLATPHTGSSYGPLLNAINMHPGMQDLKIGSPFLQWLNGPQSLGQGWCKYYTVIGVDDEFVTQGSGIPSGVFNISASFISDSLQSTHSCIHERLWTNGVAQFIQNNVTTLRMDPNLLSVVPMECTVNEQETDNPWVFAKAFLMLQPEFSLPAVPIQAVWRITPEGGLCETYEVRKQVLHFDPQTNPQFTNFVEQMDDMGLINSPMVEADWLDTPHGSSISLTRIDEDIPWCPSAAMPTCELWIYIGEGSGPAGLPLITLGPFQ